MKVIIPEERLAEVFATLPEEDGKTGDQALKPKFEFGTHKDLLRFLNDKTKLNEYAYPLIFLETPIMATGNDQLVNVKNCTLIFAHRSKAELSPRQRLEGTIKYRIRPALENALKALNQSGITRITNKDSFSTEVFYNYGSTPQEKEHTATEIWDAIRLKVDLEINAKCIRPINY